MERKYSWAALAIALATAHGGLTLIRGFVAGMGIVLDAAHIYPAEWLLLAAVFVISLLPTMVMTLTMARRDGARR